MEISEISKDVHYMYSVITDVKLIEFLGPSTFRNREQSRNRPLKVETEEKQYFITIIVDFLEAGLRPFNPEYSEQRRLLSNIQPSVVWPAPSIVFIYRSLLTKAVIEKTVNQMRKFPSLLNFTSNYLVVRRSDGSLLPVLFPPFTSSLLKHLQNSKWDQAIRLCRQIQDDALWAVLAGMATDAKNLYAAEIAYGALNEGEKVVFLAEARNEQNKDVRSAMFLMLPGRISEAESSLERSGHAYRAVMLNVKMFRWSRALDIALKNKKHLEIVLGYRQKYLDEFNKKETDPKFLKHMGDVEVDWEHIREVVAEEEAKLKDK